MRMADDGWNQGWHERNGGNLTYRMKKEEAESIREELSEDGEWKEIGTAVPAPVSYTHLDVYKRQVHTQEYPGIPSG